MLATIVFVITLSVDSQAQFIVRVRPVAPVMIRTIAPSPRHVWVDGDYVWREGRYDYNNGYWAEPPFPGQRWIKGHWKNKRSGWVWVPGHWRKF